MQGAMRCRQTAACGSTAHTNALRDCNALSLCTCRTCQQASVCCRWLQGWMSTPAAMLTVQALVWAATMPLLRMAQRALQVHAAARQQGAAQCMHAIAQRRRCCFSDTRKELHACSCVQRNTSAVLWQAADLAAPVGAGCERTAHHRHAPLVPAACMHVKASSMTLAGPMSTSVLMALHVRLYPWAAKAYQKKRLSVPLQWNARIRAPGRGTLSTRAAASV